METQNVSPLAEAVKKHKAVLGVFGNGRFSPAMNEVFKDTQRLFGFTGVQAHVTALRIGVDAGALNASQVKLSYKDSKTQSLREITEAVKMEHRSWAITIGYLCAEIDKLRKKGLIPTDIDIDPTIMEFVNDAASRIEAVTSL